MNDRITQTYPYVMESQSMIPGVENVRFEHIGNYLIARAQVVREPRQYQGTPINFRFIVDPKYCNIPGWR